MKAIIKRELASYFRNPVGPMLIGAYGILSGICFILSVVANMTTNMSSYFGVWLYFVNVVFVCLLSFRFFSEEKKNKTDQLLLTAPVSLFSVVMGKFLSAVIIYSAGSAVNILYAFVLGTFPNFAKGESIAVSDFIIQFIGILLVGYAMIAVALFISSLTESQIGTVAATFAVLVIMYVADSVASFLPGWMEAALKSISMYSRYSDFSVGLLSLAPTVFYISVAALFVFLTMRMIEKRRWA